MIVDLEWLQLVCVCSPLLKLPSDRGSGGGVEGVPPLIALITLGAFGRHRLSAHRWLSSVQVLPAVTNDFLFQMANLA